MPEGDTIWLAAQKLRPVLEGRTITQVSCRWPNVVEGLQGRSVDRIETKGKHLLIHVGRDVIRIHLKMTGAWSVQNKPPPASGDLGLMLATEAGAASCYRVPDVERCDVRALDTHPLLSRLGPDVIAEGFNPEAVMSRVSRDVRSGCRGHVRGGVRGGPFDRPQLPRRRPWVAHPGAGRDTFDGVGGSREVRRDDGGDTRRAADDRSWAWADSPPDGVRGAEVTQQVRLAGWEPGLRKVGLTKLLQDECGLDLKAAREKVTSLLRGEPVEVAVQPGHAESFIGTATGLGARAEYVDPEASEKTYPTFVVGFSGDELTSEDDALVEVLRTANPLWRRLHDAARKDAPMDITWWACKHSTCVYFEHMRSDVVVYSWDGYAVDVSARRVVEISRPLRVEVTGDPALVDSVVNRLLVFASAAATPIRVEGDFGTKLRIFRRMLHLAGGDGLPLDDGDRFLNVRLNEPLATLLREAATRVLDAALLEAETAGEVLLDQNVACGIGNIYRCEILFLERVAPSTLLSKVDRPERLWARAVRLMRANLRPGLRNTTGQARPEHWVYGRHGKPCVRCGSTIQAEQGGDRNRIAWWCPRCQPS
jgi:formamidopyrimidine-DNA glycosylase